MVGLVWWVWSRVRDRSIEAGSKRRVGLLSRARIDASRWWKHGLRLAGPQDGHEPSGARSRRFQVRAHAQSGRRREAEGSGGQGRGCSGRLRYQDGLGVGPKQFGLWLLGVVDRVDDESDCGRLAEGLASLLGGADRWHTGEGGFRVEVVISWYGGEGVQSVRLAVRCERVEWDRRHAVRFESGTLWLWHFDFGPWQRPWTHAPVSAAWRRIVKGGSSAQEIPAYLRTGTVVGGGIGRESEWARLLLAMYLGTSGYRILLRGQETERDAYGLGQAS